MKFCVQFPVISYPAKKKGGVGWGQQNALPLYPLQIETKIEKSVVLSQTSVPGVARMSPGRVSLLYGQPQPEYTCQSKNTKDRSQGYFICQVFLGIFVFLRSDPMSNPCKHFITEPRVSVPLLTHLLVMVQPDSRAREQ